MSSHQTAIERQAVADALLRAGPWYCTDDEDALISHAEAQADHLDRIRMRGGDAAALEAGERRIIAHGLSLPDAESERGTVARLCCSIWWRRQLRRLNSRRLEQRERVLGRVHDRAGIYVSNHGAAKRRAQHTRNAKMLEGVTATNQDGQEYTLAELAELGLANPNNRRAELMLRIADTEREANRLGHVGLFLTVTCPSRFHAIHHGTGVENRKWADAERPDPREGQAYLQSLWRRAGAKLGRKHLGIYGIRVVEPHHDGAPHWHLLMWCEPQNAGAVLGIMRQYAIDEDWHEIAPKLNAKGELAEPEEKALERESRRFDAKVIDPERGTAAGYVAKYISKNINGEQFTRQGVDGDHLDQYGHDLTTAAPRIEAWAGVWGIRQFQFFGLPSVTVWREARRLRDPADLLTWQDERNPDADAFATMGKLWHAADRGQWAEFLRIMGGPMTKRDDQPARPWKITRIGLGGVMQEGRYAEPLQTHIGIVVQGVECLTKRHLWTMHRKPAPVAFDLEALTFRAESAARTRVNNCTRRQGAGRNAPPGPKALGFLGKIFGPKGSPLTEWEWHVTESIRRMKPVFDRETVADIHRATAADAIAAQKADALRRAERQQAREDRERVEQAENRIIHWLAHGHITETDALEALTA